MVARKSGSLEPVEAFTVIVLFAALADGNVEQEEMDIIVNVLARMNAFRRYRGDISDRETATLEILANNLSVSKTKVTKIVEVMAIKNRG
jgi:hypothetical protein